MLGGNICELVQLTAVPARRVHLLLTCSSMAYKFSRFEPRKALLGFAETSSEQLYSARVCPEKEFERNGRRLFQQTATG